LYGLKQTPHTWYEKLIEHILKINFENFNIDDVTLFIRKVGKIVVYLVVYIDDLLITRNNESYIAYMKQYLKRCFEIKNMGHIIIIWKLK